MVAFKMNTTRTLAQNNNQSAFLLACYGYLLPKKGFKLNISVNLLSMKVHIMPNLWGCLKHGLLGNVACFSVYFFFKET